MKKLLLSLCIASVVTTAYAVEEIQSWKFINKGSTATAEIVSSDGIGIELTCKIKSGPMVATLTLPKAFSESQPSIWFTLETNTVDTIRDYEKTKSEKFKPPRLQEKEVRVEDRPPNHEVHFAGHLVESAFENSDVYKAELSRQYEGKFMLRILRDAWTKIRLTAEYRIRPDPEKDYSLVSGSVFISSANSTATFRQFNVGFCGM